MDVAAGFGWSFYGFFAAAVVWLAIYFAWAARAAARDRQQARRQANGR